MMKSNALRALSTAAVAFALAATYSAQAQESSSAMAAPKCDLETIQKLCSESDACVSVEKGAWEGGYNVTSKDKESENKFLTETVVPNCM